MKDSWQDNQNKYYFQVWHEIFERDYSFQQLVGNYDPFLKQTTQCNYNTGG